MFSTKLFLRSFYVFQHHTTTSLTCELHIGVKLKECQNREQPL